VKAQRRAEEKAGGVPAPLDLHQTMGQLRDYEGAAGRLAGVERGAGCTHAKTLQSSAVFAGEGRMASGWRSAGGPALLPKVAASRDGCMALKKVTPAFGFQRLHSHRSGTAVPQYRSTAVAVCC
jgi:hypothetical protein